MEPVSPRNLPSYAEKPRFSAGVRAGASGAVGRDAQGTATSGLSAVISLSGPISYPPELRLTRQGSCIASAARVADIVVWGGGTHNACFGDP
jgi:hypothetical protein